MGAKPYVNSSGQSNFECSSGSFSFLSFFSSLPNPSPFTFLISQGSNLGHLKISSYHSNKVLSREKLNQNKSSQVVIYIYREFKVCSFILTLIVPRNKIEMKICKSIIK